MDIPIKWTAQAVSLLACTLATAAEGPTCLEGTEHYLAGNQCVYLTRSRTAKAFVLDPDTSFSDFASRAREAGAVTERLSVPPRSPDIVILRQPSGSTSCFFCDAAVVEVMESLASELPVFITREAELIMHDVFIVQLADRARREETAELIESLGAEVVEETPPVDYRLLAQFPDLSPEEALGRINQLHRHELVRFAEPYFTQLSRRTQPAERDRSQEPSRTPQSGEPRRSAVEDDTSSADTAPHAGFAGALAGAAASAMDDDDPCASLSDDEYAGYQWALCNDGYDGAVLDADIDAPEAWGEVACSASVMVAVIDDGVDKHHPQFHDRVKEPFDAALRPDIPNPNKFDYHGTAVAGILGASTGDGQHIAGVCGKVVILPVRIGFTTTNSAHWQTDAKIIDRAIRHAVDGGASVINGSWTSYRSSTIEAAIEYAIVEKKRVLVFAAGNDASSVSFPANLTETAVSPTVRESIIAVVATNSRDELVATSNRGPAATIAAPGWDILTTDIGGPDGYYKYDWAWFYETSAAAPFVSGVAALLLSAHPGATPAQIREWLEVGADDLGDPLQFGSGRLNARGALDAAAP